MKLYYIPNGPKNLATLFPAVNWNNVAEYYIQIKEGCDGDAIATSVMNQMDGECCIDVVRVHFLNYSGTWDAVNFKLFVEEHEAKSTFFTKPTNYPLVKSEHAISRFGVKANDTLTLSNRDYREENQKWLNELIDSPVILMEKGDEYIPLTIEDQKMLNHKFEDRYEYELIIQVKPSHERFIIRN
jgi:hypothetical protein